jgi:hypothetical protein
MWVASDRCIKNGAMRIAGRSKTDRRVHHEARPQARAMATWFLRSQVWRLGDTVERYSLKSRYSAAAWVGCGLDRTGSRSCGANQGDTVMGVFTNKGSDLAPAVVFDNNKFGNPPLFHMLYKLENDEGGNNDLLYVTSSDGQNWNNVDLKQQPSGQSTSAAPAVALYLTDTKEGETPERFALVCIYVANDSSKRLLYTTLDLLAPVDQRGWTAGVQVGGETAQWVSTPANSPGLSNDVVRVYFISKDKSNRIMETTFKPW